MNFKQYEFNQVDLDAENNSKPPTSLRVAAAPSSKADGEDGDKWASFEVIVKL